MSYSDYFPTLAWLSMRWKRIFAYTAIAFVTLAMSALVALHVDEYILRSRAERLQRDLDKVVIGKTTLAEARGILQVSGSSSETIEKREDEANSAFDIYLNGRLARHLENLLGTSPQKERQFTRACLLMGVHPSLVRVWVVFRGGVVTEKGFIVSVASPAQSESAKWLGGRASVAPELRIGPFEQLEFPKRELQIHPGYVVGHNGGVSLAPGYPVESEYIWLKLTPAVNPGDFERLTRFNLDCLTQWRPCRTAADLMPEAWKQFKEDLGSTKETPPGFQYQ